MTSIWSKRVTEMVKYIAPVKVYPGELEMEAMACGALRVLTGQEEAKVYSGVPVWSGFEKSAAVAGALIDAEASLEGD